MKMYKRKLYTRREQDYSQELRHELEKAEQILLKIGPCRERRLALTKLNEVLLWANVAIAEAGVADYEQ